MTKSELIEKGKHKVRNTPDLMHIYKSLFAEQFGYSPNCAGCTFEGDWRKFTSTSSTKPLTTMENKQRTYELRDKKNPIISFKKDGRTHHAYANNTTDEFMIGYLSSGTEDELKERAKMFKKLPAGMKKETEAPVKKKRQSKVK